MDIVKLFRSIPVVAAVACAVGTGACRDVSIGAGIERNRSTALTIAAASDLRYALDEIAAAFERAAPGFDVAVSYGSSGSFYAQIVNGAPFDLFLSADIAYARQLEARGVVGPGGAFKYAEGRLAVWVRNASPLDVAALGLRALTAGDVAHVAIANPEHAPYGRAAVAALQAAGVLEAVRPGIVLGENVSQTLQFVQSGSADAGIVALSLAMAPQVAGAGRYWVVPAGMHPPIEQGGAVLRASAHAGAAGAFRAFLLGDEARAVLRRYGFAVDGW